MRVALCVFFAVLLLSASSVEAKKTKAKKQIAIGDIAQNVVTGVEVVATTATSATLAWSAPAIAEGITGYRIHMSVSMTDAGIDTNLLTQEGRATGTVTGLIPSSLYRAHISPMYGETAGTPSPDVMVQTLPLPPQGLHAAAIGRDYVDLEWSASPVHGNLVNVGQVISVSLRGSNDDPILIETGVRTNNYTLANLTASTTYIVAVASDNVQGMSEFSNVIEFTTSPTVMSTVSCGSTLIRRGGEALCTIISRDMNGHVNDADPEDFVVTSMSGRVSALSVVNGQIVFTYHCPEIAEIDEISVSLATNATAIIAGSPITMRVAGMPSAMSELSCASLDTHLGGELQCSIKALDVHGYTVSALDTDFVVTAANGGVSALSSEDGITWTFTYSAPVEGLSDILYATLAETGSHLMGSQLTVQLYGVPSVNSRVTCTKDHAPIKKGVRCIFEPLSDLGLPIQIYIDSVAFSVTEGTVRALRQMPELTKYNFTVRAPSTGDGGWATFTGMRVSDGAVFSGVPKQLLWLGIPTTDSVVTCTPSSPELVIGQGTAMCTIIPHDVDSVIYARRRDFMARAIRGKVSKMQWSADRKTIEFTYKAPRTGKAGVDVLSVYIRTDASMTQLQGAPITFPIVKALPPAPVSPAAAEHKAHKDHNKIQKNPQL